ncbi:hypothetical protein [Maritimibacter dapengensis]|uniref:Tripartite ATP-independent transporter, DctQ component n=1 Tax=Maritimibacter dapengensis TaxID=2836868 RepID=A0ABS6SXG9_9RHOB|nr:hypothetical protein [Maritimibacter dapengensis]MBV7377663.1 hypothetical protein [Maritimibacter dapengensis]
MSETDRRRQTVGRDSDVSGDDVKRSNSKRSQSQIIDKLFVVILFVVVGGFELLLGWAVYREIAQPVGYTGSSVNLVPLIALGILTLIAAAAVFPRNPEFDQR